MSTEHEIIKLHQSIVISKCVFDRLMDERDKMREELDVLKMEVLEAKLEKTQDILSKMRADVIMKTQEIKSLRERLDAKSS